jgi:tRNA threonylcarbamoyladenosine biosynthesis protein TsaE
MALCGEHLADERQQNAPVSLNENRRIFYFSGTMKVMEKPVNTLAELAAEAEYFVSELEPREGGATLVTLSGELGAGKTAFTKAVARALGVEEIVNSPTFVLEKIYQLGSETPKFKRLIHIDAYRLEAGGDLAPLGFDELMEDTSNLIVLEWPEKVADALPVPAVRISLVLHSDNSRSISYD